MSIRLKLLITVNLVLISALAILLVLDYRVGLAARLRDKQIALSEEADVLLPAIIALQHHGSGAVQNYIDQACARMQDITSPSHHIAVLLDQEVLQARAHDRDSPSIVEAMRQAETAPDYQADVDGHPILVGARSDNEVSVYVSEYTTNVIVAARSWLMIRAVGIAILGLVTALLINVVLMRLVSRPIDRLVKKVRGVGQGHFDVVNERFGSTELDYLSNEIVAMSDSLAEADRHRKQQMSKARQIQQNLLPRSDHLDTAGIRLTHRPAEDVGGDFFDVKFMNEHELTICIGDVVGHGVPAAMSAGMLKTLFSQSSEWSCDPADVLSDINRQFHAVTLEGNFATMMMVVLDRHDGRLCYASAGHVAGHLVRTSGDVIDLKTTGMLLGIDPTAQCSTKVLEVNRGDTLVLLTDGLIETISPDGVLLGSEALRAALQACDRVGLVRDIANALLTLADQHRSGGVQADDVTLAVVRI